ncbi:MAG TPA: CGNR zinc finger domain-containing protein [Acidothermaceae bacterium]|nr:CGNR zinc finger domain-containing protein [Acidothermaceae bacterium]
MGPLHHLDQILSTLTALINTSPHIASTEELGTVDAVRAFVESRSITEVGPPTQADLATLHTVRRRLFAIFAAPDEETKIALVNQTLASASIEPRLVVHDGFGIHFHFFPPYASLSEHINADCAMALAVLLASGEANRLRICGAPNCNRVMVDNSKNRSRAYCDSRTCGNRVHAAAYRDRQRAEEMASR